MGNVQIRDVPEDVHSELRRRAAAEGVSLSEYLLRELARLAKRPPAADVLARRAERTQGPTTDEIVAVIRASRDARA